MGVSYSAYMCVRQSQLMLISGIKLLLSIILVLCMCSLVGATVNLTSTL